MSDVEGKSESLGQEEFRRNDVLRRSLRKLRSEAPQGRVVVLGLGRKEERGCHHFFGVVGHWGVGEVEAFEILYRCSLRSFIR